MNTRGACENEARYVKEINCSNFCSFDCYLIYRGDKKVPIPKHRKFDNPQRQKDHDLYIWALGGEEPDWVKAKKESPPPDKWIVSFPDGTVYIWDDFEKHYIRYILGKGMWVDQTFKPKVPPDVDEDAYYKNLDNKKFHGENSEYYKAVINRINDVQFNPKLQNLQFPKPTRKRGVKKGAIRGSYKISKKKKRTFVCKGCGRTFTMKSSKRQQYHSDAC